MRNLALLVILPLLLAATPATKPTATQPAADPSAPRAALLLYDKLVGANEADKAIGLYHSSATRERAIASLLADLDGKIAALVAASAKKWDKATAESLARAVGSKTATDINAAKIEVTGDTATVLFPDDESPVQMLKVDGEWKISVKHLVQQVSKDLPLDRFRKSLTSLAGSIQKITQQIEQGQIPTADAAKTQLEAARRSAFTISE